MNTVEPIRDKNQVLDMADYLKARSKRNYMMFMFGIYTGLRISDILKLRVRDVRGKRSIYTREIKTGKEKHFVINAELVPIIREYVDGKEDYEYLFKTGRDRNSPITRQQAYNVLNDAAKELGISRVGTHTLRKTWGYHTYQQTHDAVTIKEILNHSDISVTLRYIGINQDNKDSIMNAVSFRKK